MDLSVQKCYGLQYKTLFCSHCTRFQVPKIIYQMEEAYIIIICENLTGFLAACFYHWWELPQVSFLLQQTCVCHDKHLFCHDKNMLVVTTPLSWQNYCDKTFVTTNIWLNKHMFVATSILLSWQKMCFLVTELLLRQKWYLWQLPSMIAVDRVVYRSVNIHTDTNLCFKLVQKNYEHLIHPEVLVQLTGCQNPRIR